MKPKRPMSEDDVSIAVPIQVSSDDMRAAASALDDLVEDTVPNTLTDVERGVLTDVAAWLRRSAKIVEPRDTQNWDVIRALRDDRETRAQNQRIASRHGVSEGSVRDASPERDARKSARIVRVIR